MNSEIFDKSRRFYENKVAPMIHEKFAEYESHIAVGLSGEGSDCFGFDDFIFAYTKLAKSTSFKAQKIILIFYAINLKSPQKLHQSKYYKKDFFHEISFKFWQNYIKFNLLVQI